MTKPTDEYPTNEIPSDDGKTSVLRDLDNYMANLPDSAVGTASLVGKREVMLVIAEKIERVMLSDDMHCLLGRFSQRKPTGMSIDLAPYDAQEHGVSRIHAQLHISENRLYLSDLDSTNGTFIGSEKLQPHKPTELHNGEQIRLGRLSMQVVFR